MKKKVWLIAAVVLLIASGTTAFVMQRRNKVRDTHAVNIDVNTVKEKQDEEEISEIRTTSENTTETSSKEKEKADKQKEDKKDKTTEASAITDKPSTTQASVQGLSSSSAATGKPNVMETPATAEKPKTTETPVATEKPNTTEAPAPSHVHKWKTINHPAETHKEEQLVCEAYDEDIYEYHMVCNACGAYLDPPMSAEERTDHMCNCNSGYTDGTIKVGTKHYDAKYETVTVVDKEAWTETVCETCGERK